MRPGYGEIKTLAGNSVDLNEMDDFEPPHQDLDYCNLVIQLFVSLLFSGLYGYRAPDILDRKSGITSHNIMMPFMSSLVWI